MATLVAAVLVLPGTLATVRRSLAGVSTADPRWLVAGGVSFFASAVLAALAWHAGLRGCEEPVRRRDVVPRYAFGSLVNSVAPPPAGEGARVALLGRLIGRPGAALTVAGVCATVAVMRALVIATLLAAATIASPAGQATAVAVVVAGAALVVATLVLTRRGATGRIASNLLRAVPRSPGTALHIAGWVAASTAARVAAATCCCAALGVPHPVAAALLIVPALELATLVPLMPANLGITSAAVTVALQQHHVALAAAMSAGITLHLVETAAGISFGLCGATALAGPTVRPRVIRLAATAGALAAVAAIGIWTDTA